MTQANTKIVPKSGLILEICKDPAEFFQSIRDDLFHITDELLIDTPQVNEQVSYAILEYFEERFGV